MPPKDSCGRDLQKSQTGKWSQKKWLLKDSSRATCWRTPKYPRWWRNQKTQTLNNPLKNGGEGLLWEGIMNDSKKSPSSHGVASEEPFHAQLFWGTAPLGVCWVFQCIPFFWNASLPAIIWSPSSLHSDNVKSSCFTCEPFLCSCGHSHLTLAVCPLHKRYTSSTNSTSVSTQKTQLSSPGWS